MRSASTELTLPSRLASPLTEAAKANGITLTQITRARITDKNFFIFLPPFYGISVSFIILSIFGFFNQKTVFVKLFLIIQVYFWNYLSILPLTFIVPSVGTTYYLDSNYSTFDVERVDSSQKPEFDGVNVTWTAFEEPGFTYVLHVLQNGIDHPVTLDTNSFNIL